MFVFRGLDGLEGGLSGQGFTMRPSELEQYPIVAFHFTPSLMLLSLRILSDRKVNHNKPMTKRPCPTHVPNSRGTARSHVGCRLTAHPRWLPPLGGLEVREAVRQRLAVLVLGVLGEPVTSLV